MDVLAWFDGARCESNDISVTIDRLSSAILRSAILWPAGIGDFVTTICPLSNFILVRQSETRAMATLSSRMKQNDARSRQVGLLDFVQALPLSLSLLRIPAWNVATSETMCLDPALRNRMSRIPTGTYRLQLHADFGFDAAAEIADYLEQLGISHVYSSPYLQAAPGSQHGYDVVDHHNVNEELGGAEAHERFSLRLGACILGQVLDIVPNHMAISGSRNRMWWDVLENGPSSRYASYFDIDWEPLEEKLRGKLLVPILGRPLRPSSGPR